MLTQELLDSGGALDGSNLVVSSNEVHPDHDEPAPTASGSGADHHIHQEDKPRSGIAAEYLAKGYVLSDGILQKVRFPFLASNRVSKDSFAQLYLCYVARRSSWTVRHLLYR